MEGIGDVSGIRRAEIQWEDRIENQKKVATGVTEAQKRWKLKVTKGDYYNAKPKAKKKAKPKAKATAKPKAAAKGGSTQDAVKALKGVVDQQGMEKTRELLDIMEALG